MRGNENQKETEKTNEVFVILIARFIEKEKIKVAEAKQRGARAINKSDRNKQREGAHRDFVKVKAIARPRMDPREPKIFKQQTRLEIIAGQAMLGEKSPNVPSHEQAERNPEKNDRCDIYGRESVVSHPREKFSNLFGHEAGT